MSESSGEEAEGIQWIPYSLRKEWSDVKPLEQNEGKDPVARIAYSEKCKLLSIVELINHLNPIPHGLFACYKYNTMPQRAR